MKHFCYLAHTNRHSSVDNLHTHCHRCMLVDVGRAGRLIYFGYARCPVPVCWFDQFTVRFGFPLHSVSLEFTLVPFAFNYTCSVAFSSLSFDLSISLSSSLLAGIFFRLPLTLISLSFFSFVLFFFADYRTSTIQKGKRFSLPAVEPFSHVRCASLSREREKR